jgi:hypothetical protein
MRFEKIKKTVLIALGFAMATYLIMSGSAMLQEEKSNAAKYLSK